MVDRRWEMWEGGVASDGLAENAPSSTNSCWTTRTVTVKQSTEIAPTYFHMAQCFARWVVIRISEMMFRYTLGTGRGKSSLNLVIVSDTVGTTLPRYELYFW